MTWTPTAKAEPVAVKCDQCGKVGGTLIKGATGTYRHEHHTFIHKPPPAPRKKGTRDRKPRRVPVTRHPETHGVRRHKKASI